jgi:hypothetical protein
MTTTNECKGRSNRLPRNNRKFMLLFARCDGDRTLQCKDQQHKYAKVEYSEYTKDRMYVAVSEHSEYAVWCVRRPGRVWQECQRKTDPHGSMTMSSNGTTVLISEADNIVPCNNQTLSLSLSTESINLRPQIN